MVELSDESQPRRSQRLQGGPGRRPRMGNRRAIYVKEDEQRVVAVLQVAHRRGVYRR
ncbi:MAG: type II toxin-antitoxin system RelE/ParE family toxin [Actinomycetota bacterium]|nr:type II toxin-antitoxin system RelE/ParE family toxin [Actinomycetota bacterium]